MPICFVVMGYGEKTDFATGRKLNLDKTYNNIVKPAVEEAGYECVRADEIRHSGIIDIPMYDMLLDAELVVADLSTSNPNALFELGVRHALRPRSTVVIAESGFANPFDVNHPSLGVTRIWGSISGTRKSYACGRNSEISSRPLPKAIGQIVPSTRCSRIWRLRIGLKASAC